MKGKKHQLYISGMHCASCAVTIQQVLEKISGVKEVNVNYAQEQAEFVLDETKTSLESIIAAIKKLGYKGSLISDQEPVSMQDLERIKELAALKFKLMVSLLLSVPIVIGAMVPGMPDWLKDSWLVLLLATPVQFWVGAHFYKSGWNAFKNHTANMNTLIALGTSVAYFYSLFVLIFKNYLLSIGLPVYTHFDSAVVIITFILLGNYLEIGAKGRASQALRKLIGLQPQTANVLQEKDSKQDWQSVSVQAVRVGDIILIKPGDNIPVDGKVISGESYVKEAMVTGESMPVQKKVGDHVIGGTINGMGSFQMRATKIGKSTFLARMIALVRHAQASKAPVQKLVDVISSYFVPIVLILSLITFLCWYNFGPVPQFMHALNSLVTVLIVACPCALGLATPTSIMVGIGRGADESILIKDAQTLEIAGNVSVVVLDKTGTLTEGHPEVSHFVFIKNLSEWAQEKNINKKDKEHIDALKNYVRSLTVSLEALSSHPISQAVLRKFKDSSTIFEGNKFQSVAGLGLQGIVDDHAVLIGPE